jgi:hypothetical protein
MDIELIEERLRGRWARERTYAGHLTLTSEALAPLRVAVRARGGASVGLSAAAVALVLIVVAGMAVIGGQRAGHGGASGSPTAAPTSGPDRSAAASSGTISEPTVLLDLGDSSLTGLVLGPDGAAYFLDTTSNQVDRMDLTSGALLTVATEGQQAPAPGEVVGGGMAVVAKPRLITTGGGDVLILDSSNSLWAWHPAVSTSGRGVLKKIFIPDSASWGAGARAIGTYVTSLALGRYNIYIVMPSAQQILKYQAAADGSGYPTAGRSNYLSVAQDVGNVTGMYVDGNVYLAADGRISKYQLGQAVAGWSLATPPALAKTPRYTVLTADNPAPDQGLLYAYDAANQRIVEFVKANGDYIAQYLGDPLAAPWLSSAGGMFVNAAADGTTKVYWTEGSYLLSASLGASAAEPSFVAEPSAVVAEPSPTPASGPLPTPVQPSGTSDPGWFQYRVLPGDTVSKVASKFSLQLWELELANPQIKNFNSLLIGQLLNIPPTAQLTQPPTTPVPS